MWLVSKQKRDTRAAPRRRAKALQRHRAGTRKPEMERTLFESEEQSADTRRRFEEEHAETLRRLAE